MVIEAAWGLGESVVGGLVIPDTYAVTSAGEIEASVGSKATRLDRRDGVLRRAPVRVVDRRRTCLSPEQVNEIADAARKAEVALGVPLDIEWAIAGDALWLLQARSITTTPGNRPGFDFQDAADQTVLVSGVGASPGQVRGTVRVVHDLDGFGSVQPGDVLVCRTTDPAWTPLFGIVAAVVTETGGVLSHAAIVARELGVPAVVGAVDAMACLPDADRVAVDGARGIVTGVA